MTGQNRTNIYLPFTFRPGIQISHNLLSQFHADQCATLGNHLAGFRINNILIEIASLNTLG